MAQVVCRIQKLKSASALSGVGRHNHRLSAQPHVNAAMTKRNRVLLGSSDIEADVNTRLADAVKNKAGGFRKNAVLAVEMILSASPEYFTDQKATDKWIEASTQWLKKTYGKNLVNVVVHLDEQTPHIHAVIVPLDKRMKLNCDGFFGSKEKLSDLQSDVAKSVAHLGISRGTKKELTGATHTEISEYRKAVNLYTETKNSVKRAVSNVEQMPSFLPVVKKDDATSYYKQVIYKAVTKALPSFLNRIIRENKALKAELAVRVKKQFDIEKQSAEARSENFRLRNKLNDMSQGMEEFKDQQPDIKAIKEEAFKEGYEVGYKSGLQAQVKAKDLTL